MLHLHPIPTQYGDGKRQAPFTLLSVLLEYHPHVAPWSVLSKSISTRSRDLVRRYICDIRKGIAPLGYDVQNIRGEGYRLTRGERP